MKTQYVPFHYCFAWAALGLVFGVTFCLMAAPLFADDKDSALQRVMQPKLTHSQQILKALLVERYDVITKRCDDLLVLSRTAEWQRDETPEYQRLSREFRTTVELLRAASIKNDLAGATEAYVSTVKTCVECHKNYR